MRSTADRIRQAVSFEAIGLLLVTPLFAWAFAHPLDQIGALALLGGTAAMLWNYLFNLGFDRALKRWRGSPRKTLKLRCAHAALFELSLMAMLLPVFAWWLDVSLAEALLMDLSFSAFYMAYTFVFTWGYDGLFPPAGARAET
ncbi:PACE efflux transporter [Marinibaculum pumilum]|uniref:PACE efflux transporter n=1 Tax=Marinibaculum pumilum TaxID=1766165 RepID=A0ABV7L5C1_9PROT